MAGGGNRPPTSLRRTSGPIRSPSSWRLTVTQAAEQASAAAPRTGLGAARKLSQQNRCAKRLPARRARTMSRRQRHQLIRSRSRGCGATTSSSPGTPLYWGATIGDQLTGEQAPWDMSAVSKFEGMAGKGVSLVNFFAPFANCASKCSFYKFPTEPMESIRQHGSIPVYSWSSQSIPSSLNEPDFQLSDVIAGNFDSYIREFAEDARDWGHPFFLRFNWEMNGNWFPWSEGVNGNQSGEFVTAWRHVHDIFTAVGASNVTWVWCPNVDPGNKLANSIASDYPGDEYVDWTGLDGYNWGPSQGRLDQLLPSLRLHLPRDHRHDRPQQAAADRRDGLDRERWLKGKLDQRSACRNPHRLPEDPGDALVRHLRRRHGLADRDFEQRHQRFRRRHPGARLPGQLLRRPAAQRDRAARLADWTFVLDCASPEQERMSCAFGLQQRSPAP